MMTIKDIQIFFERREIPTRTTVYRRYNVVLFKVDPEHTTTVQMTFDRIRPPFMTFMYRHLNWWDRFLLRKRKIRVELR